MTDDRKLDPDAEVTPELLDEIDFSQKSDTLKQLDAKIQEAESERQLTSKDPFKGLYILTYKGAGPVESVFFKSNRVPPVIQRDCQIWCKSKGFRYISFKPALVNILDTMSGQSINSLPAGDITDIVTQQSRRALVGSEF